MIRYSIKEVRTGLVSKIDREKKAKINNKVGVIIPGHDETQICIIDNKTKEAIDIFEPEKCYPFLGKEKDGYIISTETIDETKEYVLSTKRAKYSYIDKIRIIKQLKEKGVIGKNKVTICEAMVGKYIKLEKTGKIYDGKVIGELEFLITKNCLCTMNLNESIATEIATETQYPILKRDKNGRLIDNQNIESGKEYVISTLTKEEVPKKKLYEIRQQLKNSTTNTP